MKRTLMTCAALTVAAAIGISQSGCGTSTGNPVVSIDVDSPSAFNLYDWFVPSAFASVSDVRFCFKRIRFKGQGKPTQANVDQDEDNLDFDVGEKSLSTGGNLGQRTVPVGVYSRIEFDLDKHCASGKSVQVTKDGVAYSSEATVSIRFEGSFLMDGLPKTIALGVQTMINALNSVGNDNDIKTKLESASGTFREK